MSYVRTKPEDKEDRKELEDLNAEQWQLDLLNLNPDYVFWGPGEDYMSTDDKGWATSTIYDSWEEFGPWDLDDLNEVVNFYFAVGRKDEECAVCEGSGYGPEAKQVSDDWYDFDNTGRKWCYDITQDEVDALIESNRLFDFTHRVVDGKWKQNDPLIIPSAEEVNTWAQKGMGHDSINKWVCVRARCNRLGYEINCPVCKGEGRLHIEPKAYASLILWVIHPRKGACKGIEINNIKEDELPEIFNFLKEAHERNTNRWKEILKK